MGSRVVSVRSTPAANRALNFASLFHSAANGPSPGQFGNSFHLFHSTTGNICPSGGPILVFTAFFASGTAVAEQGSEICVMIDALFSQPNYLGAKKALDGVALRQEALASNIANLETPGYKRVDLSPSFSEQLSRACAAGDGGQISSLNPQMAVDTTATASSPDGNNVNLESELIKMNQNTLAHALETQLISGQLMKLKLAITGKPS
jgi:flagellar basal-body rod protein FlgB